MINSDLFYYDENPAFSFALMFLLVEDKGGYSVLFEKRSSKIHQAGEICLPGGKREAGESAIAAAKRETWEELGADGIEIWGHLPFERDLRGRIVQPVVGFIKKETLRIKVSVDEVASYFFCPLDYLRNNCPVKIRDIEDDFPHLKKLFAGYELFADFNDFCWLYENEAIWGLTGRVVRRFVKIINDGK